ncbi:hypothetical protein [Serratia marcescens]|uniref:hypothetical protein n=1 Tax=Serratia marcescens TaxID=615 RepID=UPI003F7D58D5
MLILVIVIADLLRELMVGVNFIYNMLFKGWNNMSTIRSLDFDEMKLIGGCGDGNNGGDRDRPSRGASNSCAGHYHWRIYRFFRRPARDDGYGGCRWLNGGRYLAQITALPGIIRITVVPRVGIKTPIALMGNVAGDE